MGKINRLSVLAGSVSLLVLAASVVAITPRVTNAGGPGGKDSEDEEQVAPGTIDDGAELLPQAGITLDAAIAAAQAAASGAIGEVDLEEYKGTLIFNVDVGADDVKVDAQTGEVLAVARD